MAKLASIDGGRRDGEAPLGSYENPFKHDRAETLAFALTDMGYDFRLNIRAKRIEYRQAVVSSDPTPWAPVDDQEIAFVRDSIEAKYHRQGAKDIVRLKYGRDRWNDCLNALLKHRKVDPFKEWLESLPAWDGETRLENVLYRLFEAPPDALSAWASSYFFLGAVQRTLEPGCKLDEIPVLIGPQGIGKGSLAKFILPPEFPELHSDGLLWDAQPKDQVDAVLGCAIAEVSEMAGRRRAEIERIKTFITRTNDGNIRRPYAHHTEYSPRRFIIVGTTNNEYDIPNDPSGNRRFVPVMLQKGANIEEWADRERAQLWAEAMRLYKEGERANLPRKLMPKAAARAEQHRDRDDLIEDVIDRLPRDREYTPGEVMDHFANSTERPTPTRVGRALGNAGWKRRKARFGQRSQWVWRFAGDG